MPGRHGDAGSLAGVPDRRAPEMNRVSRRRVLRDDAADAERLVVRMREDASDARLRLRQLSAPAAAEKAENEHEHVEQIEIDLHGGEHVVVLAEATAAHEAPRVEHEQAAEDQDADDRQPEV